MIFASGQGKTGPAPDAQASFTAVKSKGRDDRSIRVKPD
jgi:hypothetical protein